MHNCCHHFTKSHLFYWLPKTFPKTLNELLPPLLLDVVPVMIRFVSFLLYLIFSKAPPTLLPEPVTFLIVPIVSYCAIKILTYVTDLLILLPFVEVKT
jgi:hypothetical protein